MRGLLPSLALGIAFWATVAAALPLPAVQILQGPPSGNYCNAARAAATFDVNTQPDGVYYAQGIMKADDEVVFIGDTMPFSYPAGMANAEFGLPPGVHAGSSYAPGTVFSTISRYFDSSLHATYENEIAIQCDTGQTTLIRNTELATGPGVPSPMQIKLVAVEGKNQCAAVGQAFSKNFSVRLTDYQGVPFSGASIFFSYDGCYSWSSQSSTCASPGYFVPDGHSYIMVQTDASGVAVAPPYVAGPAPGIASVYAYPPPGLAPYYFGYSPSLNNIVAFTGLEQFEDAGSACEFLFGSGFE
jgi:hypothetical protein